MFSLYWLTREWAVLHPAVGKTWELLDWQRISLPISGTLTALFPIHIQAGLPTGFLLASGWRHLPFFPKTRSYFFRVSAPFEDCGGWGWWTPWPRAWGNRSGQGWKKDSITECRCIPCPVQPLAQNLALSVERASDLHRVIQLRMVITSAQESLVNKFQLIRIKVNN